MNEKQLNIMGVTHCSAVDGPGLRTVVWFQGCKNRCKGCHNPDSWDTEKEVQLVTAEELYKLVAPNKLEDGITLSGGDPLWQKNLDVLSKFIQMYKFCNPEKNIWLYTGFVWEDIFWSEQYMLDRQHNDQYRSLFKCIDVVVDGKFREDLKTENCIYRGSSNQRLIDVQATIVNTVSEPILFDLSKIPV